MKILRLKEDEANFNEEVQQTILQTLFPKRFGHDQALQEDSKEHEFDENLLRSIGQRDPVGLLSLLKQDLQPLESDECGMKSLYEPAAIDFDVYPRTKRKRDKGEVDSGN